MQAKSKKGYNAIKKTEKKIEVLQEPQAKNKTYFCNTHFYSKKVSCKQIYNFMF